MKVDSIYHYMLGLGYKIDLYHIDDDLQELQGYKKIKEDDKSQKVVYLPKRIFKTNQKFLDENVENL